MKDEEMVCDDKPGASVHLKLMGNFWALDVRKKSATS